MTSKLNRMEFSRPPSATVFMTRALAPVKRNAPVVPEFAATWHVQPDRSRLERFLALTGTPTGETLPILYPLTVGFRLVMVATTHTTFPVPIWTNLQLRDQVLQHAPIPSGAPFTLRLRTRGGRVAEKGLEVDLYLAAELDGAVAWESVVTFYTRGRFGPAEPPSPLAKAPAEFGTPVTSWTLSRRGHWQFGRLTGDFNGIHQWDWYARLLGFRHAFYHPGRVLSDALARLGLARPRDPTRVDLWLKGPVPHGSKAELRTGADAGATTFGVFVEPERPALVGRVALAGADARL